MTRAFASSVVLKQTNDLFLQRCQNAGLVPTCNCVHGNLLGCLGQGQFQITHFGLDYRMADQVLNQSRLINLTCQVESESIFRDFSSSVNPELGAGGRLQDEQTAA